MSMVATTAISARDAKPVPKERLLAYQEPDDKRTFPIIVTRDTGFVGGACYLELWIEDVKVGIFDRGETAKFYVEPLIYTAEVNWDQQGKGLCGLNNRPSYHEVGSRDRKVKNAYHIGIIGEMPMIGIGN